MNTMYERVRQVGVLPVVSFSNAEQAVSACKALAKGGIAAAEITLRTDAAAECIRAVREAMPDFLVGAGSVITVELAQTALDAGAQFLVSPGFSGEIVEFAQTHDLVIFPGCSNATDLMQASRYGLPVVKFFPAESLGGLSMLKAIAAPFPRLQFMSTGGLNPDNLASWLSYDRVFSCGGSWLVKEAWLKNGDWEAITRAAQETVHVIQEVR